MTLALLRMVYEIITYLTSGRNKDQVFWYFPRNGHLSIHYIQYVVQIINKHVGIIYNFIYLLLYAIVKSKYTFFVKILIILFEIELSI